jgi:hypothetical protein
VRRPRGRPPLPESRRRDETVHARVSVDVHEAICRRASTERKTVSTLVAEILAAVFRENKIRVTTST